MSLSIVLALTVQRQGSIPPIDNYYRGRADGVKWALRKIIDGKMILAPPEISDGITISNCVIIRIVKVESALSFDKDAHVDMNHNIFYGDVDFYSLP